jgi:ribokinase
VVVVAERLPGPGETVVGQGPERHGGGKGANAAVAAARAGAAVALVGAVGADDTGGAALAELEATGVDVSGVSRLADQATGVALIAVDRRGENQIAVGAGANGALSADAVRASLASRLAGCGCVLVSTEISGPAVAAAIREAAEHDVPCVLNPAPVVGEVLDALALGPMLTPNTAELDRLVDALDERGARAGGSGVDALAPLASRLAERTRAPAVVTLGAQGALVVQPGRDHVHVPAVATEVRDTTGAGDTFNGVLAARLAAGDDLLRAVRLATVAASLSVAKPGARAGMPTLAAIEDALRDA